MKSDQGHRKFYRNSGLTKICLLTLLFFLRAGILSAETSDSLFLSDEILNLELRSDFSAIEKSRTGEPQYFEGELVCFPAGSPSVKFPVKVSVRGQFRRNPEICSFPPLFLKFKEKEVRNTIFDNQDKLKLVTPCQDEEDVIEEYIVYRMYNQVTDMSMKVRLAKILYFDTSTGKELFEKYSFFIEDKDQVASRNGAVLEKGFLTPFALEKDNYMKMALFEYMIGNKDWYVTSKKNVVIMQSADPPIELEAVPYDFDLSGFIDAVYGNPPGVPDYRLVDPRIYRGLCNTNEEFNRTFEFFRKLKPVFESVINSQELIPKYKRRQLIRYIGQFYSVIDNERLFRREILSVCQTMKDYNIAEVHK
jgi:hypothetical protein